MGKEYILKEEVQKIINEMFEKNKEVQNSEILLDLLQKFNQ